MSKKIFIIILVTLSLGVFLVQYSYGEEYPTKAIEILCTVTPGSSMDIISRLIAGISSKYLGQPVVVVNKEGASGSVAVSDIISSKPDGYKLLIHASTYFTTVKTQKVPFDPNNVVPIASFAENKHVMVVKSDSPWKTLNDLLDYGRKNPNKLTWAVAGRGIPIHLKGLMVFKKAGIETKAIPYKGSPEVLSALLGGHVDASIMVYGGVKDHVTTGRVRCLISLSERRYIDLPDVPSANELNFPEVAKISALIGVYAHKNTPEDIKKILFDVFKKTYENPEFKKGIENLGEELRFEGPESLKEIIKKTQEVGVPILKELGLYVEK